MTTVVILDADLLSALLKIERLPLVRQFYRVEQLIVPPAVYREVAVTPLFLLLLEFPWVVVKSPERGSIEILTREEATGRLGAGEREAIALAIGRSGCVLLMNDAQAGRLAARFGVSVVNLPAFLMACKLAGLLDRAQMEEMIFALWEKDHYRFREDVQDLLLA